MTATFSPKTVTIITNRDRGCCAWCGRPINGERGVDWSVHHRQPRGMGGTKARHANLPSAGVLLHGSGTTGCHGLVETHRGRAIEAGFLVSRLGVQKPSAVAIQHAVHGYCWLGDDGSVLTVQEANEGVKF